MFSVRESVEAFRVGKNPPHRRMEDEKPFDDAGRGRK